jgi:hypothetical protein
VVTCRTPSRPATAHAPWTPAMLLLCTAMHRTRQAHSPTGRPTRAPPAAVASVRPLAVLHRLGSALLAELHPVSATARFAAPGSPRPGTAREIISDAAAPAGFGTEAVRPVVINAEAQTAAAGGPCRTQPPTRQLQQQKQGAQQPRNVRMHTGSRPRGRPAGGSGAPSAQRPGRLGWQPLVSVAARGRRPRAREVGS